MNVVNGGDDKWSDAAKLDITYCVSRSSFGGNHDRVVAATRDAAAAWELAASVDFVHVASSDGDCTAAQPNVVFDVRQVSGQGYLARAFFPSSGAGRETSSRHLGVRQQRGVVADRHGAANANRTAIGPWERFGLIRVGVGKVVLRSYTGHYVVAEHGGGGVVRANRTAIGPWEQFGLEDAGDGAIALRAHNTHYVVAEDGGGNVLNGNRGAIGPWERFRIVPL